MKLIHLPDLHIGLGEKETENTEKIFAHIADRHPGPVVVITGGIVDSGRKLNPFFQYHSSSNFKIMHLCLNNFDLSWPILLNKP